MPLLFVNGEECRDDMIALIHCHFSIVLLTEHNVGSAKMKTLVQTLSLNERRISSCL